MRRYHEERKIVRRREKAYKEIQGRTVDKPGRLRKTHIFDCGRTRYYICHQDKLPTRPLTRKEKLAQKDLEEYYE